MLVGGALVLAGRLLGGGQPNPQAMAAPAGGGVDNGWAVAVPSGGWVLAKGADSIAYKVTVEGWRPVGAENKQGPLRLYP